MFVLLKHAFLVSCLFAGWVVALIAVAECSVYPPEVSDDGGLGPPLPLSSVKSLGFFSSLYSFIRFPGGSRESVNTVIRGFSNLQEIYLNISSDQLGPGNVSCHDSLIRSDRLMLLYSLFSKLEEIWTSAGCKQCLTQNQESLSNDTVYFLTTLNLSLTCFETYQGNHSELCKDCKASYKRLNELYGRMEKNQTLCIDIEDGMNMTRRLWSKNFGCSFPREETVPVIAVSSFMLFLPIIFYLSSFLHSEQKKRKLIHPKEPSPAAA